MTVEQRLQEFMDQSGTDVPPTFQNFIEIVRAYTSCGLSYNLMMQLIEWEWEHESGGQAYGIEYLHRQLKIMADEVEMLAKLCKDNDIEIPDD